MVGGDVLGRIINTALDLMVVVALTLGAVVVMLVSWDATNLVRRYLRDRRWRRYFRDW